MSEANPASRRSRFTQLLLGLGIFVVVLGGVFLVVRYVVDRAVSDASRRIIEQRLTAALGLGVEIRGEFQVELLPRPHFRVHDLVILNPPGEPSPYLLEVGTVALALDLADLLSGEFHISDLDFLSVEIHFDGALEALVVEPHPENLADEKTDGTLPFEIRSLELEDVEIYYGEEGARGPWSIHLDRMEVQSRRFDAPVKLMASGNVEGSPFDLKGKLGSISELVAPTRPYPVRIAGHVFEGEVSLDGQIATPLALEGVDLALAARFDDIAALVKEPGRSLPSLGPLAATGHLVDRGGVLALEQLNVSLSGAAIHGTLQGGIGDVRAGTGLDLDLGVSVELRTVLETLAGRPLPSFVPAALSATLDDLAALAKAPASVAPATAPIFGPIAARARLVDRGGVLALEELHVTLSDAAIQGSVHGSIADVSAVTGVDLALGVEIEVMTVVGSLAGRSLPSLVSSEVSATLGDLAALAREPRRGLPPLGPVAATGRLVDRDGVLALEALQVTLSDAALHGSVSGAIADVAAGTGVALELGASVDEMSLLDALADRKLPKLVPIAISASLVERDGRMGVKARLSAGKANGDVRIKLEGSHGDLREMAGLDVGFEIVARDLRRIGEYLALETTLPAIGPVTVKGRLTGRREALGVEKLSFLIGARNAIWAEGEGAIGNLAELTGIQVAARFGVEHLGALKELTGGDPPEVGPIRGSAQLTDRDGTLGVERFQVEGGREGVLALHVVGAFDDFRHLDEISVDGKLEARDLAVLGELAGEALPALGPVSFTGKVKGSNGKVESHGEARIDQTLFTGDWSGSFPEGGRPRIDVALHSDHVRLRDIGVEPSDEQLLQALPPDEVRKAGERWWEGTAALPFDSLRRVDGRVVLALARITGRNDFALSDTKATLSLENGDLAIPDFATTYEGGSVSGALRIDARTSVPEVSLVGEVAGASLAVLTAQFTTQTRSAGIVDASVDLRGRGDSIDAIRSSLDGELTMRFRDWAVASLYMDRVVKDMISAFIRMASDEPPDALDCVAVDLAIDAGIAKVRDFVLETDEATVRGKGKIDLRTGKIDVTLTPEVRNPSLLGIAAEVDVKGPLDDPEFRSSKRSLATSATKGLVYNALRPAIALVDAFRNSSSAPRTADTVCRPSNAPKSKALKTKATRDPS